MWGASGGDAEAVEDVEDDGEVVEGDVGGSGVEAEDRAVGAHAEMWAQAAGWRGRRPGRGRRRWWSAGAGDEGDEGLEVVAAAARGRRARSKRAGVVVIEGGDFTDERRVVDQIAKPTRRLVS